MPADTVRLILAVVVGAHGIGHVLFMPLLFDAMRLDASGRSWLLTPVLGETPVRLLASVVAGLLVLGFVAAAAAFALRLPWWRIVVLVSSVASVVLVVVLWGGLPSSPAFFGLAFDVVILAALLLAHWPPEDAIPL